MLFGAIMLLGWTVVSICHVATASADQVIRSKRIDSELATGNGATTAKRKVIVDFDASVTYVYGEIPELSGLIGETGNGSIRYDGNPYRSFTYSNSTCEGYDFDALHASFFFELPSAALILRAGSSEDTSVNVEICNGFRDFIQGPQLQLVDRMRFFGFAINQFLGRFPIANMVVRFADTSATTLGDTLLSNLLAPEQYDVANLWVMVGLGSGTTTAGLELAIDAVTVRDQCVGDCDGNDIVSVDELVVGVNLLLGRSSNSCDAFDNMAEIVDVAQLVQSVHNALRGCR